MRKNDLEKLVQANIISAEKQHEIEDFLNSHWWFWWFQKSLTTLWSFLIALWIFSLVALNRDGMSDLWKISILLIGIIISFIGWISLKNNDKKLLWSSLLFLSWLILWAAIFLIAQIYHLTISNDILLLIWIVLIAPLVYIAKQSEYYYLLMLLLSWFVLQFAFSHHFPDPDYRTIIVLYIIFWFLMILAWYLHDRRYSEKLLAKLFKIFWADLAVIAFFVFIVSNWFDWPYTPPQFITIFSIILYAAFMFRNLVAKQKELILIGMLFIVMIASIFLDVTLLYYIIFIWWCLLMIYLGYYKSNSFLSKSAMVYLYIFLLYLYGIYWREYQNKALFFIIWWVLMIWLWVWFSKLHTFLPNYLQLNENNE